MVIPEAAVEAALTAFSEEIAKIGALHRDALRAALESAEPHRLSEAWEEGRRSYRDDLSGYPSFGTPGYKESRNPYMPDNEGEK